MRVWAPETKTEVPSTVMVDSIAPKLTNAMWLLGSCFHRCDQMMPSMTMNKPRLGVVQNGPIRARR